ncbi:hypothetical protein ACFLT7_06075 [candidate division KSB1 bacterium]
MKGFNLPQCGHIVNALPPESGTTAVTSDYFHLEHGHHFDAIVTIGSNGSTGNGALTVLNSTTDSSGSAVGFNYQAEETAAGDTLGSWSTASASGRTISTNNNIMYAISVDAAEQSGKWWAIRLATSTGVIEKAVTAVITGHRYQQERTPTAIA